MENSQSQQASTNPSISTSHVRKVYTNEDVVRIRPTTRKGDVWSNFDMCIMIDGVEKARCKKCMKFYNPASNTTLRTHKNGCNAVSQNDTSQGTIGADGQVFIFDNDAVRLDFTKFVIQQALPFNHFDNVKLTEIIKRRLQPRYQHVSRTTLRSDAFKLWETAKKDIIDGFRDYKYGVSITTDTWTAPHVVTLDWLSLPNICITSSVLSSPITCSSSTPSIVSLNPVLSPLDILNHNPAILHCSLIQCVGGGS
ncbi:hypothetical protein Tco_0990890 [Tanacetum coccineum]|uniref:BED-type domain-containing protein n=1 Tax=Tanacetum coccineum TaxID=301880 RepID=A0ABQ5EXQ5_9ASTR